MLAFPIMKSGFVDVNNLHMYYETHGQGQPLLLLHGEFATTEIFAALIPRLETQRRLILVEQQGHGHTADIDRPLSFAQMADDTAALLDHLQVRSVDVFGYSGGGTVALQLALKRRHLVGKIALASTIYDERGYFPGVMEALKSSSPDAFPLEIREAYDKVAPDPQKWATLVYKSAEMAKNPSTAGFLTVDQLEMVGAPTLVLMGQDDFIEPEYAKNMARLLRTELKVLPGDHSSYLTSDPQHLLELITPFFGMS